MPNDPRDDRDPAYYQEGYNTVGASDRWGQQPSQFVARAEEGYGNVFDPLDPAQNPYPDSGDDDDLYGAIPFDIGGYTAREDARRLEYEKGQRRDLWAGLAGLAPRADDLTPHYLLESNRDAYGDLMGGASELEGLGGQERSTQYQALRNLAELGNNGGLGAGDRAQMQANRLQQGAWMRGQSDAALQQMQARGMGGSGAELAMRLGAAQSANMANAMGDASIMQGAQQRALQAMMGAGQLGGQMYDQDMARRNALDAFNQANLGWRRDREQRNTATVNRQQDANTQARQQAYQNQERAVAGWDQQYSTDAQSRNAQAERSQENSEAQGDALAGIVAAICCHPDTPIATPDGDRPISELRAGDLVLSVHRGLVQAVPLVAVQSVGVADHTVQRVALSTGVVLHITPNHPTADGYGIGELKAGDMLGGVRIVSTEPVAYDQPATFDILPDSDSATYLAGGAHLGSTMKGLRR